MATNYGVGGKPSPQPAQWRYDFDPATGVSRASYPGEVVATSGGIVNPELFGMIAGSDDLRIVAANSAAFQLAMNFAAQIGGNVQFPGKIYSIDPNLIAGFPGGITISGDGSTSRLKLVPVVPPVTAGNYQLLRPYNYTNVSDVTIRDIILDGNKDNIVWTGVVGDGSGNGVGLWGTTNVYLDNVKSINCYTDGFSFNQTHSSQVTRRNCSNVRFGSLYAINCGRQGLTITSAINVMGANFYAQDIQRTSPGAAIDLEPDVMSDLIQNITIAQVVANNVRAGVLLSGVSPIQDVAFGTVALHGVTNLSGFAVQKAKNVQVGSLLVEMASNAFYGFYATDFQNLTVDSVLISQTTPISVGAGGGIFIDSLPAGNTYTNLGLYIGYALVDGTSGGGFRQNIGTAQIGYAEVRNVNKSNGGYDAFALLATCSFGNIVATDGTGKYAIEISGSSTNSFVTGTVSAGVTGTIALNGQWVASWGTLIADGVNYPVRRSGTVAQLPAASVNLRGYRSVVTDANSVLFNAAAAGGGANVMPVVCNGTGWVIG
jgi:hypothetical protein